MDRVRIQPYSFDEESLRQSEHTFNIDRVTAGCLYEKNPDFRKLLDSGKFIYADGHMIESHISSPLPGEDIRLFDADLCELTLDSSDEIV